MAKHTKNEGDGSTPTNWIKGLRRKSSKSASTEDDVFEKCTDQPANCVAENSGLPPANWISRMRRKSSKTDEKATREEDNQESLPRRMLRRASDLLQEKMEGISTAASTYAEESYAAANDPETAIYRSPEEKYVLCQLNGGAYVR